MVSHIFPTNVEIPVFPKACKTTYLSLQSGYSLVFPPIVASGISPPIRGARCPLGLHDVIPHWSVRVSLRLSECPFVSPLNCQQYFPHQSEVPVVPNHKLRLSFLTPHGLIQYFLPIRFKGCPSVL